MKHLFITALIAFLCFGFYNPANASGGWNKKENAIKGCTEEARICPDGSAVGRTGPNCEFAPCPSQEPQIICTMDAQQCPDGRWVGRSGPNCTFDCSTATKPPQPKHGPHTLPTE